MKYLSEIYVLLLLLFALPGCDSFRQHSHEGVVAELNGHTLTEQDLLPLTVGLSTEDSLQVVSDYIRSWAINILQYDQVMGRVDDRIEAMVSDYRQSLYIYAYEQALIARKMPKEVEDSVLLQFYNAHQNQFVLRESILRGILLVIPEKSPKQANLRKLLANPTEDNLEKIEKYAYQYSAGYELFTSQWRTANEILLRLPVERDILQKDLRSRSLIEVKDSTMIYLLQVTDKHLAGDYMPFDYAADEIKQIVLTERQADFLRAQREKLYGDALRHKKLKLYNVQNEK
ncbi:MAG: hypothetical protein J6T32_05670 [Paludibacteraceae bacterium]|nr:hypothetical protein [Paludibacteraceae bacterium]